MISLISPYPNISCYGIRSLSASLKTNGFKVKLIFLPHRFTNPYSSNQLTELNKLCKKSELIGISLLTNFFTNTLQLTQSLKQLQIPILWGGVHPTIRPEECLNYADMVCLGEGEETIVELAENPNKTNISGIWFKNNNNIVKNPVRPLLQNLDLLPLPDHDYKSHHILMEKKIKKMDKKIYQKFTECIYMTIASRGCPFKCAYCCNNTYTKIFPEWNRVRRRSINNLIEELTIAKKSIKPERVLFDDDCFFSYSREELEYFSKEYKGKVGLPLRITGFNSIWFDREKFKSLLNAGLECVRMGIQSGSPRVRRIYKRKANNRRMLEVANELQKHKLDIYYDIILDCPWEKEEDTIQTLKLLTKIQKPYRLNLFSLTFFPGSDLYEKAKNDDLIKDDLNDVYNKFFGKFKPTDLNILFMLIGKRQIPNWFINFLIDSHNNMLRYPLSLMLKFYLGLFYFKEGINALSNKDITKIIHFFKTKNG